MTNHMDNPDLDEVATDILREMYAEAEPPLDFDEPKNSPDQMDDDWYKHHYLPNEEQQRIFDKHTEGLDLTDAENMSLAMTCLLDLAPTGVPVEE